LEHERVDLSVDAKEYGMADLWELWKAVMMAVKMVVTMVLRKVAT